MLRLVRWKDTHCAVKTFYTHRNTRVHPLCLHTRTNMAVLIPPLVNCCLREMLAHHFLSLNLFIGIHILCISLSLPLSFSFFSHHWLCPNLATSEGWLSCIWIAQCLTTRATNPHCGSGDSLSYTSNKGKLPVNTMTVSSSENTLNHTPCAQLQGGNLDLTCTLCARVCVFGCICGHMSTRVCACVFAGRATVCMNL